MEQSINALLLGLGLIGGVILISYILKPLLSQKDMEKKKQDDEYYIENDIPSTSLKVKCIKYNDKDIWRNLCAWIKDNTLNFQIEAGHSSQHIKEKIIIPIDNIVFYERNGEYRKFEEIVSVKPNIKKAIVGGIIAGQAGAIIGAMDSKVEKETKVVDKRKTYLYYEENDIMNVMIFESKDFGTLFKLIPLKAKNIVKENE